MAHAYTPGLRVSAQTIIRKNRRLPLAGEVLVSVGERVNPETIVAQTKLPGAVHTVNVANTLGIAPEDVPGVMLKAAGDQITKNELMAQSKGIFGLFKSAVTAPVSGTIELISSVTGQVLLREPPAPVQAQAYIEGVVVAVLPNEGVTIETSGAFIQGIFGIGGETRGPLTLLTEDPEATIGPELITSNHAGCIVCGGATITLAALQKLQVVGAVGVVVGSARYRDIGDLLGYQIGVAITGGEDIGLTVILTEGFGRMRMADRTLDILKRHNGRTVSICGATQIRAGVMRPELIIPLPDFETGARSSESAAIGLGVGSQVRIIRNPHFGQMGIVTSLPEQPQALPTEAVVRVLEVQLPSGDVVVVPRANVEHVEV